MPDRRVQSDLINDSMQRAFDKVTSEYPNVKKPQLSQFNMIERLLAPRDTVALTNPFTGNISYNPQSMQTMSPDDREQTVAHELVHSREAQDTPWYKTAFRALMPQEEYSKRPGEMAAYQAEKDRASRLNLRGIVDPLTGSSDIQLPSMKRRKPQTGVGPTPNFQTVK
jgi:hypothetical protein